MGKLKRFTLGFNDDRNRWELKNDKTDRVLQRFLTKENATKGGVLKRALGSEGGSVKIKKLNERYEEERTFPRKKDPRQSEG